MPTSNTAIFPGRFQPPHMGHILTLMRLYPLYDEIIITVSSYTFGGKKPQVIEPTEAVRTLQEVFKYLPKFKVLYIGTGFIERSSFDDLPHFDVVVTGDSEVARHMKELGIEYSWVPRSKIGGMEISSTLVRRALTLIDDADYQGLV